MNRRIATRPAFRFSRLTVSLGFLLALGVTQALRANAATIVVNNATDAPLPFICDLRQAIVAHNEEKSPAFSSCKAGDGNGDIIKLDIIGDTIDIGSPMNAIENGGVTIEPSKNNVCYNLRQSTYLTVAKGGGLTLKGISVVVNGAEFKSVIDNDGGTLTIMRNGTSGPCLFSNQNGRDRKPRLGGILFNRNNGTTTIADASLNDSSASEKGGAIYIDSGTLNIQRGNYSGNNSGGDGGAIWSQGTLNIQSSNFSISNNTAGGSGGAIYSNGGTVSIQRSTSQTLGNISISSNKANNGSGGAIFATGGKLNIDGIQIISNSASGNGGAIQLGNIPLPNPASVTRTYFQDNSKGSGNGGSIYSTEGSTLNISGDTFFRDGGGIYVDALGTLGVINSTFLGSSSAKEGITLASGSVDVTFATILLANLSGPVSGFNLSNSLLREVMDCTNVTDDKNNLKNTSSSSCPGTDTSNLGLDPKFLQNNGGFTPTIALLAGSPAIAAVPLGDCLDLSGNPLTVDQRGFSRPVAGTCSTGSYQFGGIAP